MYFTQLIIIINTNGMYDWYERNILVVNNRLVFAVTSVQFVAIILSFQIASFIAIWTTQNRT